MAAPWIDVAAAALLVLAATWGLVLVLFARPLSARWREPVFRHPILILESDDWGAGPLTQVDALRQILRVLSEFRDQTGRSPVMTLGMVFEVPDTRRIAEEGIGVYHAMGLDEACFRELRTAIHEGVAAGIFEPQLHGQCHYWPDAIVTAANADRAVRDWLTRAGFSRTEDLPSPLQSRWTDASVLPSCPLPDDSIESAVRTETETFRRHFGELPCAVVPTTFVWTRPVETAWDRSGIEIVITPGRRATCRGGRGEPAGVDRVILAGERSDAGQTYLVRDVYFEPSIGHTPERLVEGLVLRTDQGRACLVEIHRFNFLDRMDESVAALRGAVVGALERFPDVRFVTPRELVLAIRERNPDLMETRRRRRLKALLRRLAEIPRLMRIVRVTGLVFPLWFIGRFV